MHKRQLRLTAVLLPLMMVGLPSWAGTLVVVDHPASASSLPPPVAPPIPSLTPSHFEVIDGSSAPVRPLAAVAATPAQVLAAAPAPGAVMTPHVAVQPWPAPAASAATPPSATSVVAPAMGTSVTAPMIQAPTVAVAPPPPPPGRLVTVAPVDHPQVRAGWGHDEPLNMALAQVVPPDWTLDWAGGEQAARVGWKGGRAWTDILAGLAQASGQDIYLDGRHRRIVIAAHDAPTPPAAYTWTLRANETLQQNVARWTRDAGWHLASWPYDIDYPVYAPVVFHGAFADPKVGPLARVARAFAHAERPLAFRLTLRDHVLRVESASASMAAPAAVPVRSPDVSAHWATPPAAPAPAGPPVNLLTPASGPAVNLSSPNTSSSHPVSERYP